MKKRGMNALGDLHNFGRSVEKTRSGWIQKPRSTFWEELFYSEKSEFRPFLEAVLGEEPVIRCLPKIRYQKPSRQPDYRLVEAVKVRAFDPDDHGLEYILEAWGGLLALASWFGMGDLHANNVFFGKCSKSGRLILMPVDIEVIFSRYAHPIQAGLLPAQKHHVPLFGFRKISGILERMTAKESLGIVFGYLRTLEKLGKQGKEISAKLLSIKGIKNAPIRIIPRNTGAYRDMLKFPEMREELKAHPSEVEQLARGDIPYFFTKISDQRIHYHVSPDLRKTASIGKKDLGLDNQSAFKNPSTLLNDADRFATLMEYGSIFLINFFLRHEFTGRLVYRNLKIDITRNSIGMNWKNSINTRMRRDRQNVFDCLG